VVVFFVVKGVDFLRVVEVVALFFVVGFFSCSTFFSSVFFAIFLSAFGVLVVWTIGTSATTGSFTSQNDVSISSTILSTVCVILSSSGVVLLTSFALDDLFLRSLATVSLNADAFAAYFGLLNFLAFFPMENSFLVI